MDDPWPTINRETASSRPDVELVKVSRTFGDVVAVDDVSLSIARGEFFSLLGPSGCGKSTTLRMIGGFETVSHGDMFLRGTRINDVPPHRRATNMVFQQLALFPHLNVAENIAFGLRLKRQPKDEIATRVKWALSLISLDGYEGRFPSQLSGGQQQRVAIARALVNEPAVLLLDEPLGALDLKLRTQMQLELKALQSRLQTTFIYVTHDQGEAFAMSDRLALMNEGRIIQIGTPRDLYERPKTRFAATFVGETNLLTARVIGREGRELIVTAKGLTLRAVAVDSIAEGAAIHLSIRPEHVKINAAIEQASATATASIVSVVFQGPFVRFGLAVDSGPEVIAQAINEGEATRLRPDDKVSVGWGADAVVVLPS